jgi:hypothetical protein
VGACGVVHTLERSYGVRGPLLLFGVSGRVTCLPAPHLARHYTVLTFSPFVTSDTFHQEPTMSFENSPVIEEGYWRNPLDSTFYMTHYGQSFKYFHQHIHQRQSTGLEEAFPRYAELPAELQLRIMQQCDAPTLFRLMHTTHDLRIEARKLFFSDPATWYRLEADLLLQHPLATESMYEPDFLASVKQLEIHSQHLNSTVWRPDLGEKTFMSSAKRSEFIDKHIKANIQAFWCIVQRCCPQVKRVMFTKDGTSFPDKNVMTDCFQRMAQLCPRGLDVFLYRTEPGEEAVGRRRKRILWRLRTSDEDTVTEIRPRREKPSETPGIIVVPAEKPHRGHVGDFIKSQKIWHKYCGQRFAAEYHRAAAVEQYHFGGCHKPFGCSVTGCDVWFDQPEQYTTHLLSTCHGKGEIVPGQAGDLVAENNKHLLLLEHKVQETHKAFWNWLGDYPSEQRTMAERVLMHQLEHDVLYAQNKPVSEHALLKLIYDIEIQMVL